MHDFFCLWGGGGLWKNNHIKRQNKLTIIVCVVAVVSKIKVYLKHRFLFFSLRHPLFGSCGKFDRQISFIYLYLYFSRH